MTTIDAGPFRERRVVLHSSGAERFAGGLLTVALWLQLAQLLLARTELDAVRLALAGTSLAMAVVVATLGASMAKRRGAACLAFAFAMILSWSLSYVVAGESSDIPLAATQLAFPLYFAFLDFSPGRRFHYHYLAICGFILAYAIYCASVYPPELLADVLRPAPFTQEGTLHNSGYIVAAIILYMIVTPWSGTGRERAYKVTLTATACILLFLYHVRTAQVMILTYLALLMLRSIKSRVGMPVVIFLGCVLFVIAVAFSSTDTVVLESFSSGRTSVYQERLAVFAERDFVPQLLGTGAGSDVMESSIWWWEEKDSHNDYLTTLIERGVLGIMLLATFVIGLMSRCRFKELALLSAILITGALSNGLMTRPIPLFFALLPIVAILQEAKRRRKPGSRSG